MDRPTARSAVWVVIFLAAIVPLLAFVAAELTGKACLWVADQIFACLDELLEDDQ